MCIEGTENQILRGYHRTQWNRDEERESRWGTELANTKECQRGQEILGTYQLLQKICKGFHKNSETNEYIDQEGHEMAMERASLVILGPALNLLLSCSDITFKVLNIQLVASEWRYFLQI